MTTVLCMSTILIFVLVVLRAVFGKRMSMRLRYALWLLVALRLIVPCQFGQSKLSAENIIRQNTKTQSSVLSYEQVSSAQPIALPATSRDVSVEPSIVSISQQDDRISPMRVIWYVGMGATALWFAAVNVIFYIRARKGAKRLQNCPLRVYVSRGISSPCQIGFSIFLTHEVAQDEARLNHVLAHEKTHFYHGDTLWSLLRAVLVCVYWFFPPVWLAAVLSKRDCELACDEGALRRLGYEERFAYGKTLLSVAAQASTAHQFFCTATTMAQSKQELTTRIKAIATKNSRPVLLTIVLIALVAVSAVCTFSGRVQATQTPSEPTVQATPVLQEPTEEARTSIPPTTSIPRRTKPTLTLPQEEEPTLTLPQEEEPTEPEIIEQPAPTVTEEVNWDTYGVGYLSYAYINQKPFNLLEDSITNPNFFSNFPYYDTSPPSYVPQPSFPGVSLPTD